MKENARLAASVADFYEIFGPSFAATRKNYWGVMKLVADRLRSGQVLLDVGAGNARLAQFLPKDVRYVAIEPSASLCAQAQAAVAERGSGEVRHGGFPRLNAADGEADVVACLAVLHHIPGHAARLAAVHELHRILKPGGSLILTVWNLRSRRFFSLKTWLASWLRLPLVRGGGLGDVWMPWRAEGHPAPRYVHAFTLSELRGLFGPDWQIDLCTPWALTTPASVLEAVNLVIIATKK